MKSVIKDVGAILLKVLVFSNRYVKPKWPLVNKFILTKCSRSEKLLFMKLLKAQVSTATVSRAFAKGSPISKKTKRKVLQAATELGYRMNHFARSLRNQQTNTIGVIVHELRSYFIISVLAGIEKVATKAGYDLYSRRKH
ncbi:MAG: LacI family DNA-binding transcriptional regulator [Ginsengibacter sp.]